MLSLESLSSLSENMVLLPRENKINKVGYKPKFTFICDTNLLAFDMYSAPEESCGKCKNPIQKRWEYTLHPEK